VITPYYDQDGITLYHGNCMEIIPTLAPGSVTCLLTDPPYSSGGMFRGDRAQSTGNKYVCSEQHGKRADFSGDNRDQRSWALWCSLWLGQCIGVMAPAAHAFVFTDWRQLPTLTDAIQAGGLVWRGIVPWNKTEGVRPQKGWFRAQCEYILTASAGNMGKEQGRQGDCMPGFWTESSGQDKHHQTGKPVSLCAFLMTPSREGVVLDPFAGSGTTLVAAQQSGRPAVGIEIEESYCDVTARRLAEGGRLFASSPTVEPDLFGGAA
jgi:site-specific DNA-methyltransferase (adenine-specific)